MSIKTFNKEEIIEILKEVIDEHRARFNNWLARGDGIAVYENKLMEGEIKPKKGQTEVYIPADMHFVSYGSPAAQIETAEPPTKMPDIGNRINWRDQLIGT